MYFHITFPYFLLRSLVTNIYVLVNVEFLILAWNIYDKQVSAEKCVKIFW